MKKILFTFILICLWAGLSAQSTFRKGIKVGNPDSPTIIQIDSLTKALNKIKFYEGATQRYPDGVTLYSDTALMLNNYLNNSNISVTEAGYLNGVTSAIQTQLSVTTVPTQINDSIAARLAASTVGVALADSNDYKPYHYATPSFVKSFVGSDTSLTGKRLQFIADVTTGAPEAGDTILIHSNFINKHVDIYRDGAKQYKNFTATNTVEGYRIRSGSDTIYVNPAFQANEQIIVDMIEPINWEFIAVEGQGSALLTGLSAYYKLDESAGVTTLVDAQGIQNGTMSGATGGVAGKFNYGKQINYKNSLRIPYNTNVSPKGATFSISMWVYLDSVASAQGKDVLLFQANNTVSPLNPHRIYIDDADDGVMFRTKNTSETEYTVKSSTVLVPDQWYHIVCVNGGNGVALKIYIDGADVSTSAGTFTGTVYEGLSETVFGNNYANSTSSMAGKIDDFGIWSIALTSDNVTTLYTNNKTHPF